MTDSQLVELWQIELAISELIRRVIELSSALTEAENRIAAVGKPKPRAKPIKPKPCNGAGVPRPLDKRTKRPVMRIEKPPKPVFDFSGEDEDARD